MYMDNYKISFKCFKSLLQFRKKLLQALLKLFSSENISLMFNKSSDPEGTCFTRLTQTCGREASIEMLRIALITSYKAEVFIFERLVMKE